MKARESLLVVSQTLLCITMTKALPPLNSPLPLVLNTNTVNSSLALPPLRSNNSSKDGVSQLPLTL